MLLNIVHAALLWIGRVMDKCSVGIQGVVCAELRRDVRAAVMLFVWIHILFCFLPRNLTHLYDVEL